ncbi:hypothetical protein [Yoonia sediminilitoris]|uniref:Aminoglycoside phosphotransferase family enzyme n=1 Tax=Yoonia sediminilitoris TaxID=1286148 RepID=A0A2T6KC57_9RHOB|nr:hypothetical protein [Yoonia sediminilitoris]PUB12442.1 aminoglycoside phosphotransferase family enzyme [Yoonia sediminilitoris]RCW93136.1 aminoglycoside phosphotransferase family enzyme [Yoonia sediminilitoris]
MPGTKSGLHIRVAQLLGNATTIETSKSWVFLTETHVYKLKKRVRDELQDLTSLRGRHDNALTEIDLNRRLAPQTYLGALRLREDANHTLALFGPGRTIDWLVEMKRLPASRMLDQMIFVHGGQREILAPFIDILARELIVFYQSCPRTCLGPDELFSVVLDQQEMNNAVLFDPLFSDQYARFNAVTDALGNLYERTYDHMADRVAKGWIRECHGDLRLEHICLIDPPAIFDCLEFNRNLRLLDPYQEITQLGIEADLMGAPWIMTALWTALADALGSPANAALRNFYVITYALLRARLCLAHLLRPAPRTPEKWLPLGLRYIAMAERSLGIEGTPDT